MTLAEAALRAEVEQMREAMMAMKYAEEMNRYHVLDGLKDNLCPCCGAAVNVISGGDDKHGNGTPPNAVRIESRW